MIKGGYILLARETLESDIMNRPPLYFKLFFWMLLQAKFKNHSNLNRGQFLTSIKEMQKAMSFMVGYRKETPSKDQIRAAYSFLTKTEMITATKTTDGLLVTILKYEEYQDPKNYESHNETHILEKQPNEASLESHGKKIVGSCQSTVSEDKAPTKPTPDPTPYNRKNDIQQDSIDKTISYKRILPAPESGETGFDRDRRIFFHAFPGLKTFQTFDDNPDRKSKKLIKLLHVKEFMPVDVTMELEKRNYYGAGVYMAINETNGKGRKSDDVVRVRAVFADFDGTPIEPVWEYEPSMVIESSPGKYHAYWLSDDIPLEGFRQLQESIAEKFKSDPKVKDLPRVMRVPGFEHRKGEPFMTKIIHFSGNKFSFDLLTEMFPPSQRPKWSGEKYTSQVNYPASEKFKGHYGVPQGGRNNHIVSRIGGMLKRDLPWGEIESEAFKEAAACSPPLSESEVRALLRSSRRYA